MKRPPSEAGLLAGIALTVAALALVPIWSASMVRLVVLGCLLATGAIVIALASRGAAKRRRLFVTSRPAHNIDEIYDGYYAGSGLSRAVVKRLWSEVADVLGLPADRLRPSDRFDKELATVGHFDPIDGRKDELAHRWATRAATLGAKLDFATVKSIGELVREMAGIEMRGTNDSSNGGAIRGT